MRAHRACLPGQAVGTPFGDAQLGGEAGRRSSHMDESLGQDQVAHLPGQDRQQVLAGSAFSQELVEGGRSASRIGAQQLLHDVPHLGRLVAGDGPHDVDQHERPARRERRQLVELGADRTEIVAHCLHDVVHCSRPQPQPRHEEALPAGVLTQAENRGPAVVPVGEAGEELPRMRLASIIVHPRRGYLPGISARRRSRPRAASSDARPYRRDVGTRTHWRSAHGGRRGSADAPPRQARREEHFLDF